MNSLSHKKKKKRKIEKGKEIKQEIKKEFKRNKSRVMNKVEKYVKKRIENVNKKREQRVVMKLITIKNKIHRVREILKKAKRKRKYSLLSINKIN